MKFFGITVLFSVVFALKYPIMRIYTPELGVTRTKLVQPGGFITEPIPKNRNFNFLLNGNTPIEHFNWMSQLTLWLVKADKSNVVTIEFNTTRDTYGKLLRTELKELDKNPAKLGEKHLIAYEEGCEVAIDTAKSYNTNKTKIDRITCINPLKKPKLRNMAKYSEIITSRYVNASFTGANVIYYVSDHRFYKDCPGCPDEAPMLYFIESVWNKHFVASACINMHKYRMQDCKESKVLATLGVKQTQFKSLGNTFCLIAHNKRPYATGRAYISPDTCVNLAGQEQGKRPPMTTEKIYIGELPTTTSATKDIKKTIDNAKDKIMGWFG